jgi:hypothetical protein
MTYTLHKLPEGGFIVTSDEKINKYDIAFEILNKVLFTVLEENDYSNSSFKKLIAQQEQIDFSALSEEEQKEIGWFDVEKLAKESIGNKYFQDEIPDAIADYKKGFQKAQELLSDRRFTLDEVRQSFWKCFENIGLGYSVTMGDLEVELSKSLSWKVEVEMEKETLYTDDGLDYKGNLIPKLTADGKIKILKLD